MKETELKELKVAKAKCLHSTLFFTRYFFKKLNGKKFIVGEHHKTIGEALDKVYRGETKRLIINIAPRYGKTELAVKMFIARGLALNPSAKFIHLSYSDSLASTNSEGTKDIIESEAYRQMFPEVELRQDAKAKKKWTTHQHGGIYATSSSGQVTGFGAGSTDGEGFGGAIIIDDPIKPDDADSSVLRDKINNKFNTTIRSRVNSRNTPIVIIMQRLHSTDLCGYLMEEEPGEWEVVSLPCIKEDGTPLWPYKHTIEELEKLKLADPVTFDRQYMQDPKPYFGLVFPEGELNRFSMDDLIGEPEAIISYIDSADEGSDSYCMVIGKMYAENVYITDVIFNDLNLDINYPSTVEKAKDNRIDYLRIETNSQGAPISRKLVDDLPSTVISPLFNTKNKNTRILVQSGFIKKNMYFRNDFEYGSEYARYFKELTQYLKTGEAKHDDSPDATAGLMNFVRTLFSNLYE